MKYQVLSISYKKFCSFALLVIILNVLYLLLHTPTTAYAAVDLGISPPILQIDATGPASVEAPITIENFSDDTVDLDIQFRPFKQGRGENGTVEYLPEDARIPGADPYIFNYVQVIDNDHVRDSIKLAPKQQKTVSLHIGLPKDEPPSDYQFSVVFLSKSALDDNNQNTSLTPAGIATNVLLSVGPKGKTDGTIEEFSAPFFVQKGPVPFTLRVKNTSKHMIIPLAQIVITNMFGQKIGKVEALPSYILPDTIRALPDTLQNPQASPSGGFKAITPLQNPKLVWQEQILLGWYKADLVMALSEKGPFFKKTIYFFALPIEAIFGIAVTFLVIIIVVIRVRRRIDQTTP